MRISVEALQLLLADEAAEPQQIESALAALKAEQQSATYTPTWRTRTRYSEIEEAAHSRLRALQTNPQTNPSPSLSDIAAQINAQLNTQLTAALNPVMQQLTMAQDAASAAA